MNGSKASVSFEKRVEMEHCSQPAEMSKQTYVKKAQALNVNCV